MSNLRTEKLASEFKRQIYDILTTKVKDPRITEMFSITKVNVDKELTYARVFVSIFSTDAQRSKDTFEAIKASSGFVRRTLYKTMRIRAVPEIDFALDNTMQEGERIEKLLAEIKKNEDIG
jgi:ribosome-binding factor A